MRAFAKLRKRLKRRVDLWEGLSESKKPGTKRPGSLKKKGK